ncbi:MAG TPA: Rrf2 family transcriptional regulator [Anaerolineaceae bacterium]
MFRISRRLDYGLQLMIALSQEPDNHAQATAVLAEKLQIPLPFLHQIGRSLIQGRLIKATPGPHGGLRLNLPAEEISLLQIVETLEGPVCISPALDGENGDREDCGYSAPVWTELQTELVEHLSGVRLSVLAAQPVTIPELVAVKK